MTADAPTSGPTAGRRLLSLRRRFALLSLLMLLPLLNLGAAFWFSIGKMGQSVTAAAGRSGTDELLVELQHVSAQVRMALLGSVLVGLVVAVIVGRMLSRAVLSPLLQIRRAAEGFGSGDLSKRVNLRRGDEFGTVADTFDEPDTGRLALHELRALGVRLSSTTTAQATARSATCATCPSTSSSSTVPSRCPASRAARRRSSARRWSSPTR